MYQSKNSNLIKHLINEHDLILLDSEIQEIDNLIDKEQAEQLILSGVVSSCACDKPIVDEWNKDSLSERPCIVCDKPIA